MREVPEDPLESRGEHQHQNRRDPDECGEEEQQQDECPREDGDLQRGAEDQQQQAAQEFHGKPLIDVSVVVSFGAAVAELQREPVDVRGLLLVDAARLDRLREKLVHAVRRLVVEARVALLERPLELVGRLRLAVQSLVQSDDRRILTSVDVLRIRRRQVRERRRHRVFDRVQQLHNDVRNVPERELPSIRRADHRSNAECVHQQRLSPMVRRDDEECVDVVLVQVRVTCPTEACLDFVLAAQRVERRPSDVHTARLAAGLGVVRCRYVIGPHVELPFAEPKDAAQHASRVNTHSHAQLDVRRLDEFPETE